MTFVWIIDRKKSKHVAPLTRGGASCQPLWTYSVPAQCLFFSIKWRLFTSSEQFSTNLQAKNTTVSDATNGAQLLVTHLKSQRTESSFECFYESVLKASSELTDEPCLPRFRKRPKRFDNGSQPHQYQTPKGRYRHIYYEALELAYGEVECRFSQTDT